MIPVDVPLVWWVLRASGLVAYAALWLAALFGVLVGSRGGGRWLDGGTLVTLHRQWSLAAVLATVAHVLALLAHPYGVSRWAVAVPFASARLTGAVALGTVAAWGLAALFASSKLQARLPKPFWRAVHGTAFGTFVLALAHGAAAGTDAGSPWVRGAYAATAAVLLAATIQRVALEVAPGTPDAQRGGKTRDSSISTASKG